MPALLTRHQVLDYGTWRRVFQDEAETRRANGSRRERQFRSATNVGEVWPLLEWDDSTAPSFSSRRMTCARRSTAAA